MTKVKRSFALGRAFGAALCAVLLLTSIGSCVTNPVTGKSQFSLVNEEQEKEMGALYYGPMIQDGWGPVNDPELQAYVQHVGEGLAKVSHRPALDYKFTVINANYDNAFALPGGKICITRGLLSRMTTEDQLAGVLGHEAGHVTARHGAQAMTRGTVAQIGLGVGGAVLASQDVKGGELILGAAGLGTQLILLRYTRDQERQSDELGMNYMAKAGYNPKGFVESMEILKAAHDKEPGKLEAMFQSHPITAERISTGEARLKQSPYAELAAHPARTADFERRTALLKGEAPAFKLADEGEKAMKEKQFRKAVALYDEAAKRAPKQAILPALKALALYGVPDYPAARDAARAALQVDPNLYQARLAAGSAEYKLKGYKASLEHLQEAEKLAGPSLTTVYFIGRDYEELGDREEAVRRYRSIVENVQQGEERTYAYNRLKEWGYLQQQPAR